MGVERVPPVEGARVVDFDYAAAGAAYDWASRTLPTKIGDQAGPRRAAAGTVTEEWRGHFRGEFDRAFAALNRRLGTAADWGPITVIGAINVAVEKANERQTRYNRERLAEIEAQRQAELERLAEAQRRAGPQPQPSPGG